MLGGSSRSQAAAAGFGQGHLAQGAGWGEEEASQTARHLTANGLFYGMGGGGCPTLTLPACCIALSVCGST